MPEITRAARILVVIGHPLADSLVHALASEYVAEASRTAEVHVVDLAVDPVPAHPVSRAELRVGPDGDTSHLDPVVDGYVADLLWADHVVMLHPQWWGTYPAVLKAWIDRVFLSGVAFRYRGKRGWDKLLTGRTARLVMTMDSPGWWNRLVYRDAAGVSLRRSVLAYVGIKTVGTTRFAAVRHVDARTREAWLGRMRRHAADDVRRLGRSSTSTTRPPVTSRPLG